MHREAKGATIKGHDIRLVSVGTVVALRLGTLRVSRISRISLVGPFRTHFRLPMEASLVTIVILARVMVSL